MLERRAGLDTLARCRRLPPVAAIVLSRIVRSTITTRYDDPRSTAVLSRRLAQIWNDVAEAHAWPSFADLLL